MNKKTLYLLAAIISFVLVITAFALLLYLVMKGMDISVLLLITLFMVIMIFWVMFFLSRAYPPKGLQEEEIKADELRKKDSVNGAV